MSAPLIGMGFLSFLILLILSAFAAAVVHWGFHYRFLSGADGFIGKWIVGWMGAWLGPAVLGHWFGPVMLWNIYIIPAILGAFAGAFGISACCKVAGTVRPERTILESTERSRAA